LTVNYGTDHGKQAKIGEKKTAREKKKKLSRQGKRYEATQASKRPQSPCAKRLGQSYEYKLRPADSLIHKQTVSLAEAKTTATRVRACWTPRGCGA
jgi:hypothetical protein